MRAELKSISSANIFDLDRYKPEDPENFGLNLDVLIGPVDEISDEIYSIFICTPKYLAGMCEKDGIVFGCNKLIMNEYNYKEIRLRIEKYIRTCSGNTWSEISEKISRIAQSEFQDYQKSYE